MTDIEEAPISDVSQGTNSPDRVFRDLLRPLRCAQVQSLKLNHSHIIARALKVTVHT
jgi:hypothetical protein